MADKRLRLACSQILPRPRVSHVIFFFFCRRPPRFNLALHLALHVLNRGCSGRPRSMDAPASSDAAQAAAKPVEPDSSAAADSDSLKRAVFKEREETDDGAPVPPAGDPSPVDPPASPRMEVLDRSIIRRQTTLTCTHFWHFVLLT